MLWSDFRAFRAIAREGAKLSRSPMRLPLEN